jgi:transposase-like protein
MSSLREPTTLLEAIRYFSNPDVALAFFVPIRWADAEPMCPRCGCTRTLFLQTRRIWKCRECAKQFSAKVGTIFEDSPIPLEKWLPAMWLLTNCKNGISSYELGRALGVTQKTAWFMLHRLRLAMHDTESGGKLSGHVEADETYIGGKARNMHADKRRRLNVKRGRSIAGKVAVMGLLERHGDNKSKIRTVVLDGLKRRHVQGHVRAVVETGSSLYTDAFSSYAGLDRDYAHKVIDHAECYVKGAVHTNGMENFWSLLKRTIKGTYVSIEPFHLFRYLDEQAFRFNQRGDVDGGRFLNVLKNVIGRRLTYKALTGSELPQTC